MADTKRCRRCRQILPVERFVDTGGNPNPRGHYCQLCHLKRFDERHRAALKRELLTIKKLRVLYDKHWRHYAVPELFQASLHDERDFCPYCGTWFDEIVPGSFNDSPLHLDHMDPLDKGGENSIRNVVVCCGPCNIQKGKRSFRDWLKMLNPQYRKLARAIYRHKHGHPPEAFTEGLSTRRDARYLERILCKPLAELRHLFPRPIVHGPPAKIRLNNHPHRRQTGDDPAEKSGQRKTGDDWPEAQKRH